MYLIAESVNYKLKIDSKHSFWFPDMLEYAKLDAQPPDRKSSVSRTWGMTYEDVFQGSITSLVDLYIAPNNRVSEYQQISFCFMDMEDIIE